MSRCTKCAFAIQHGARPKMSERSPEVDAPTVGKAGRKVRLGMAWRETGLRQPMRWNLPPFVRGLPMVVGWANAMLRNWS